MKKGQISAQQLSKLFLPQRLSSGQSYHQIQLMGGVSAFQNLLKTNFSTGLKSLKEQKWRSSYYGQNITDQVQQKSLLKMIQNTFAHLKFLYAFLFSLSLSVKFSSISNITEILLMLITSTALFPLLIQQVKSKFYTIQQKQYYQVYRESQLVSINKKDILVGDIVWLQKQMFVPADGILISGLKMNHNNLPQIKQCSDSEDIFLLSGTYVVGNKGKMLVLAVGDHSYVMKNKKITHQQFVISTFSSLQYQSILYLIIKILLLRTIFKNILFSWYHFEDIIDDLIQIIKSAKDFIYVFLIFQTTLKITKILCQIQTKLNLKQKGIQIRTMGALQNLPYLTDIVVDKKGIFTVKQTQAVRMFVEEKDLNQFYPSEISDYTLELIGKGICNNSTAVPIIESVDQVVKVNQIGNKIDCGLLEIAFRLGYDYTKVRRQKVMRRFPFRQHIKCTAVAVTSQLHQDMQLGNVDVFVKGAPEKLLPFCSYYVNHEGIHIEINDEYLEKIQLILVEYSKNSLNPILLAYRKSSEVPQDWIEVSYGLVILGVVGLKNEVKPNILEQIDFLVDRGLKIRLVTGDSRYTTIELGKQLNLLEKDWDEKIENCSVMQGEQLQQFINGQMYSQAGPKKKTYSQIVQQLAILSRSSCYQKLILIKILQKCRRVVGVITQNIRDANSLASADIGIVFQNSPPQLKTVASIIFKDDKLSHIISCVNQCEKSNVVFMRGVAGHIIFASTSIIFLTFCKLYNQVCVFNTWHFLITAILNTFDSMLTIRLENKKIKKKNIATSQQEITTKLGLISIVNSLILISMVVFSHQIFGDQEDMELHADYSTRLTYLLFFTYLSLLMFSGISIRLENYSHQQLMSQLIRQYQIYVFCLIKCLLIFGMKQCLRFINITISFKQFGLCLLLGFSHLAYSLMKLNLKKIEYTLKQQ